MPDGQLGAGLVQVAGVEAVVHHGVVVGGADGVLRHPRLLPALLAGIREDVAGGAKMMSIKRLYNKQSLLKVEYRKFGGKGIMCAEEPITADLSGWVQDVI